MAEMGSNLTFFTVMALPAKNPSFNGTLVRTAFPTVQKPRFFTVAKPFLRPQKSVASQSFEYPDPIPEFAVAETRRFKQELLRRLSKEKDTFGNDLQTVVDICAEIFSEFLHEEYGGPGTLLIEPFTDMMVALKEKDLPGAPTAARASLLWAQNYVDQDWEDWMVKLQK